MILTRRDAFATIFMAASVAIYAIHRSAAGGFISSTRAATAIVLVIGLAVCALGQAGDLYARDSDNNMAVLGAWMSLIGVFALLAAVAGIALGAEAALLALVLASSALWLAATARHQLTAKPPGRERDVQEADSAPGYPEVSADVDYPTAVEFPKPAAPGPRTHELIEPEARQHGSPVG